MYFAADEAEIERIHTEKGVNVYLASARAQMTTRVVSVAPAGGEEIGATRPPRRQDEGSVTFPTSSLATACGRH